MRALFAPVAVCLLALSGCCFIDGFCTEAQAGEFNNAAPAPELDAIATPGCDADLRVSDAGVVCADCDFVSDPGLAPSTICGLADVAVCETRENGLGNACQLCVTDDGTILYDDCFAGQADRESAFCEDFAGASDAEVCSACFDADGNTTSTTCTPRSDECHDVVDASGRVCSECTRDGAVVYRACESVDIDPAVCRAYENDLGRCVDCLDDTGALLSHACTPVGGGVGIVCDETVSPEGLACTICVDENGTPVDQSCDAVVASRCEQLNFTEQSCIVCVDDGNAVTTIDCQRNDCDVATAACRTDADCATGQVCFDGACVAPNDGNSGGPGEPVAPPPATCEAPAACTMSLNAAGDPCRTCPFTDDTGAVQQETLCLSASSLTCSVVVEGTGSGGAADPTDPTQQGRSCVVCADTASGVEVYRDCAGNGNVLPPYCVDEPKTDGSLCAVCYDSVENTPVYTSCPDTPGGETCFALESTTLNDASGAPLGVTVGDVTSDAVVSCKQCSASADTIGVDAAEAARSFSSSCALTNVCEDPYGSSFAESCPSTTTLTLAPSVCANPYDAWIFADQNADADVVTLRAILAFALSDHALALAGARVVAAGDASACAIDDCACDTGARVEVSVKDADVDAVRAIFADLIVAP